MPQSAQTLRNRLDELIDRRDQQAALAPQLLLEATAVLDLALSAALNGKVDAAQIDLPALGAVALLHLIRGQALGQPEGGPDLHASVALYTVIGAIDPQTVPPPVRAAVADARRQGAPRDLATALAWAAENHSAVLESVWRATGDVRVLDARIMALLRVLTAASQDRPEYINVMIDLARARVARYAALGERADLDVAIGTLRLAVTRPGEREAVAAAHHLLGVVLTERASRPGQDGDLDDAISAFEEALRLTAPDSPTAATLKDELAAARAQRR